MQIFDIEDIISNGETTRELSSILTTSKSDMDILKLRLYCEHYRDIEFDGDEIDQLCYNLQLMDAKKQLTIVGLLFFGHQITRFLPQAGIEMNCFRGLDVTTDILDYKTENSDIPFLVNAAIHFVKLNSRVRPQFDPENVVRNDQADYEPFAVRELVVNAFMHRDWSIFGQKIRVNLFCDRLEVFSPGPLPNTLTLENALFGISYHRNPIIAQMLKDYKLADKVGRGIQKIMKHFRSKGLKTPEFDSQPGYFRAILYNVNSGD
jgi:ATP-dependent DNA helicase RecG